MPPQLRAVHPEPYVFWFSSEANARLFDAEPWRYIPAFGGHCTHGIASPAQPAREPVRERHAGAGSSGAGARAPHCVLVLVPVLVLVLVLMLVLVRQGSRNDLTPSLLADGRVAFTCINTTQWVVLQNRTCVHIR